MTADHPPVFKVLMTAAEAFPEFERCMLEARREVHASFRVFDPWTRLRSSQAKETGTFWFDLIAATLTRGVRISIVISDFDPVACPSNHRASWASLRALIAAGEVSGKAHLLQASVAMHPARVGALPKFLFGPKIRAQLAKQAKVLNDMSPARRQRYLEEAPLLRPLMSEDKNGVSPARGRGASLVPATHHQKLAVFDRELLYIGGLDLDDRRFDTPRHRQPAEQTWHDLQLLVGGKMARDAQRHLDSFQAVNHGAMPPPKTPALLRTISRARKHAMLSMSPKNVSHEIATAHESHAARAQHLIYLETQYFRNLRYARHLARLARDNPRLTLILILPAAPDDVAFENNTGSDARYGEYLQAKSVGIIRKAFGDRLFIGAPAQRRTGGGNGRASFEDAPLVYLHAKVSIFDESAAIVSSANLNGRSLYWDTEAGVCLTGAAEISKLRRRCFEHWLGADAGPEFFELANACKSWAARARENQSRPPEERRGFLLAYSERPARRFGRNLPGVPEELV